VNGSVDGPLLATDDAICGDELCSATESCSSCSTDCGSCSPQTLSVDDTTSGVLALQTVTLDGDSQEFLLHQLDTIIIPLELSYFNITITNITENDIAISYDQVYTLSAGEETSIDFTTDGLPDVMIKVIQINNLTAMVQVTRNNQQPAQQPAATVATLDEQETVPAAVEDKAVVDLAADKQYQQVVAKSRGLWWLLIIAVALGVLLSVYGYHYLRHSKRLAAASKSLVAEYVENVRKQGFKDDQIRQTLLDHGYSEEEVNQAMK